MPNDLKHIYHGLLVDFNTFNLGMLFIVGLNSCLGWMAPPEFCKFGVWAHLQHGFIFETSVGPILLGNFTFISVRY